MQIIQQQMGLLLYVTKVHISAKIFSIMLPPISSFEIDFVTNKGSKRYYIQSALTVAEEDKRLQEINSLTRVRDSSKKIVVVKDNIMPWHDEQGILYIGIEDFLLDESAVDM